MMIHWDTYFGNENSHEGNPGAEKISKGNPMKKKPPIMSTMLIAWISFWIAMSVNEQIGPMIALAVGAYLPIFMKTNYIIAAGWGMIYIMMAVWTFFLSGTSFVNIVMILNNIMPAGMGIFTVWFQKWYPMWVAGGKQI